LQDQDKARNFYFQIRQGEARMEDIDQGETRLEEHKARRDEA